MFELTLAILGLVLITQGLKYHGQDIHLSFIRVRATIVLAVGAFLLTGFLLLVFMEYFMTNGF
jgi:hypothetical protein